VVFLFPGAWRGKGLGFWYFKNAAVADHFEGVHGWLAPAVLIIFLVLIPLIPLKYEAPMADHVLHRVAQLLGIEDGSFVINIHVDFSPD
jgi:hypothetical protein